MTRWKGLLITLLAMMIWNTAAEAENTMTEYTAAIPAGYFTPAAQRGTLEKIEYQTKDYTRNDGKTIIKPAYVYLPYGYDPNDAETRYDILYLMHGWTMTAEDFAQDAMCTLFDNMISHGDIPPMIIVSATFDAENASQSFGRSVNEIAVFHEDFRKDLVPAVEGRYHTWAADTTEEALKASRTHRAFGGFSLGAVTTWYEFVYDLDIVGSFLPMSGDCWILQTYGGLYQPVETVDYLERVIDEGGWRETDFMIYEGIGTSDGIWDQTDSQIQEMFTRPTFTANNLRYGIKRNGRHDLNACAEYIYNALPLFFSREENP